MAEDVAQTVQRFFDEIVNKQDLDVIPDVVASTYREHDTVNPGLSGHEGMRRRIGLYVATFPDLTVSVEKKVVEGDEVAIRWNLRGTHEGELMGIEPTGKLVDITGTTIFRVGSGKIEETWWNWDTVGLLKQLGVM